MPTRDPAKSIKDAVAAHWDTAQPTWTATLHVDDDWRPTQDKPATLLVADDGGPAIHPGPWILHARRRDHHHPETPPTALRSAIRRPLMRMTAFAEGRSKAREVIEDAVDWLLANQPADIARIDDVSDILITRDPDTGNFLGSVLMPVIVRPL